MSAKILDNEQTRQQVASKLKALGVRDAEIDVTAGAGATQSAQTLSIQIVTDRTAANGIIRSLAPALQNQVPDWNTLPATQIGLCRVLLVDGAGQVLVDYYWDLEVRTQGWKMASGMPDWSGAGPASEPGVSPNLSTSIPAYPEP